MAAEMYMPGLSSMARKKAAKRSAKAVRVPAKPSTSAALAPQQVERSIIVLRGHKVLLDEQLSAFYDVETRALIQAVGRNPERFPSDFMFQLSREEWAALKSQNVISKPTGRGGRRTAPYAFTEQGVAMLSSVLRSARAVEVNIEIMRAFARLRQMISAHKRLADRIATLEARMAGRDAKVDQQIKQIVALLHRLFNPSDLPRKPIGFHSEHDDATPRKG